MKNIIFVCAICLQLRWSYGRPEGVGAYAYSDSAGNRYGGTYGLKDGQAYNFKNTDAPTTFAPNPFTDFQDIDSFFPEYFRNLESLIQEAFAKNAQHQKKALGAARKAFELTSNKAGYVPNLDTDTGYNSFPSFPNFGFPPPEFNMPAFSTNPGFGGFGSHFMPNFGSFGNSAFAGGAVAPGFRHQMVALNPKNPSMPNIDVTQFSDPNPDDTDRGGFYSVKSSSFVTSANINGKETSQKGGETIINDNGKITKYSLKD